MSYLSQIWIGKHEAAKLRLSDNYAWHKALWMAFPGKDGQARQFLFRIDDKRQSFRVLLMSPESPLLLNWGLWETKQISATFLKHDRYLFQLRANPTVKRIVQNEDGGEKKNGRRTAIFDEPGLRAWIGRKAAQSGFDIDDCSISPPMDNFFINKQQKRGKHCSVDFKGMLRVKDHGGFARAFHQGIGSAKAFGFGLLMLQPIV